MTTRFRSPRRDASEQVAFEIRRYRAERDGGIFVDSAPREGMRRNLSESIAVMLETHDVSLLELVEPRISLEVPLAGLAARHGSDAVAADLLAAIGEAEGNHPASEAFRAADARFHRGIAGAAHNELLRAFTSWTLDVLQPSLIDTIGASMDGQAILDQHRAIQRAIRLRQPAAAQRAMRRHLDYLSEFVRSLGPTTPMGEL